MHKIFFVSQNLRIPIQDMGVVAAAPRPASLLRSFRPSSGFLGSSSARSARGHGGPPLGAAPVVQAAAIGAAAAPSPQRVGLNQNARATRDPNSGHHSPLSERPRTPPPTAVIGNRDLGAAGNNYNAPVSATNGGAGASGRVWGLI